MTVGELVDELSGSDPLAPVFAMGNPVLSAKQNAFTFEVQPGETAWTDDQQECVIALLRKILTANVGSGSAKAVLADWVEGIIDDAAAVLEDLEG